MGKDSVLKKQFTTRDVNRIRNLVTKNLGNKTRTQVGYQKVFELHKEGDVWEDNGKTWTIKDGIQQRVTKYDELKKVLKIPLRCPSCGGPMKHHLAKKMYKIHGFCFDPCTVKFEASLRRAGLYKEYERSMITGNMKGFLNDLEAWMDDYMMEEESFVTEGGDIEKWASNKNIKRDLSEQLRGYIDLSREQLK